MTGQRQLGLHHPKTTFHTSSWAWRSWDGQRRHIHISNGWLLIQNWTTAWLLRFYASQLGVRDPRTPEVCEQWANAQLPPRVKDFAQRVLCHKLTVHEGVYKRSRTDKCPICAQKESIKHAMVECPMFKAATAVTQHYVGPVITGDGEFSVREMMEPDYQEWLLSTTKAGQCGRQEVPTGDTDVKSRRERHQCSHHT